MRLRSILPSSLAAFAALAIFAGSAYAWPDDCESGSTFTDPETGGTCTATGTTTEVGGYTFCVANCPDGQKSFSIHPE